MVNYKERKHKKTNRKILILSVLLASSVSINATIGISKGVKALKNISEYNWDGLQYEDMVEDSVDRTDDLQNFQIVPSLLASKFLAEVPANRGEFYHQLLAVASTHDMKYQQDENFQMFINYLELDKLALENPVYPTEEEFKKFLEDNNLIVGSKIDFKKWEELDRKVFAFQKDVEEDFGKGGK